MITPDRPGRGRLGPHRRRHLPRPDARLSSAKYGDQPLAVLRQARPDACGCSRSTRRGRSSGTTRSCAGDQLRARPPGAAGDGGGPLVGSAHRPVPAPGPAGLLATRTSTRSSGRSARARRRSPAATCAAARRSSTRPTPRRRCGRAARQAQQLAEIGLEVEIRHVPIHIATAAYLEQARRAGRAVGHRARPLDAQHPRPARLSQRYCSRGSSSAARTLAGFASSGYDSELRRAARVPQAPATATARTATLDVRLARDAAPLAALNVLNEATLVSDRVGCIVLRPALDLTAVCLEVAATAPAPSPRPVLLRRRFPTGAFPTSIVSTTSFVSGSMRETVPAAVFATQTAPAPTATDSGPSPTAIVLTAPPAGSIRASDVVALDRDPDRALARRDPGGSPADGELLERRFLERRRVRSAGRSSRPSSRPRPSRSRPSRRRAALRRRASPRR